MHCPGITRGEQFIAIQIQLITLIYRSRNNNSHCNRTGTRLVVVVFRPKLFCIRHPLASPGCCVSYASAQIAVTVRVFGS